MIRLLLGALIFAVCTATLAAAPKKPEPSAPVRQCLPLDPLMEKLKASGLEFEDITARAAVVRITLAIRANLKGEEPFPNPTRLVIVFLREEARIGIIVGDKVCAIVNGPSDKVRALVHAVSGQSVVR